MDSIMFATAHRGHYFNDFQSLGERNRSEETILPLRVAGLVGPGKVGPVVSLLPPPPFFFLCWRRPVPLCKNPRSPWLRARNPRRSERRTRPTETNFAFQSSSPTEMKQDSCHWYLAPSAEPFSSVAFHIRRAARGSGYTSVHCWSM